MQLCTVHLVILVIGAALGLCKHLVGNGIYAKVAVTT